MKRLADLLWGLAALLAIFGLLLPDLLRMHEAQKPRYRCIITNEDEVLCFEPNGGRMFRPEKRFDRFILEVEK